MKVLITGGAGFIGGNLVRELNLLYPNLQLYVFDLFGRQASLGSFQNIINTNCRIISGDLSNPADLRSLLEYRFDFIYHLGAISDTTEYDQHLVFSTNVNSFYSILRYCSDYKVPLVYASSAAVYGNTPTPNTIDCVHPLNPYAFSKYQMDIIAEDYYDRIPTLIGLRFFNVFGPGEDFKGKTASTILQFANQAIENQRIKLFENSDKYFRDFIYIKDVTDVLLKCLEKKQIHGVFNLGFGRKRSFQEVAEIVVTNIQNRFNIGHVDIEYIKNNFSKYYQADTLAEISDTKLVFDFIPEWDLEKGIADYINILIKRKSIN